MKTGTIMKGLVWVVLLACFFVAPLVLIWQLSQAEIAAYEPPVEMEILLGAYGEAKKPVRQDVKEYVTVSGKVISDSIAYQELTMDKPGKIRWVVNTNIAVNAGEVLGYYEDQPVKAEYTGIFKSYSLSAGDAYLRFDTFDNLLLTCDLNEESLGYLEGSADYLTNAEGKKVTIARTSPLPNANGTTTVYLSVEDADFFCGQSVSGFAVNTGRVYPNVLTLDVNCVYQKPGEKGVHYVREVTQQGSFLTEHKVTVGYSDGQFICVTGVDEGKYYDSGYKAVIEGGN